MNSEQDHAFLSDFCTRWLAGWNSHDTDTMLALLHPDIIWDDRTFWNRVLHGHTEMRMYIDKIWEVMHDVHFEEIESFHARDRLRAVVLFQQSGSAPRKLGGNRFSTHGCDIFLEFKDGLLSHYLASYDIVDMMRQIGALPERGDKIGGAYLLSLGKPGAGAASV